MPAIYLASRSPRRHELLTQMRVTHEVMVPPSPPGEDEPRLPGESPAQYVERTARDKAQRGVQYIQELNLPPKPVLAADTTVILGEDILGKPATLDEATSMLERLSGNCHEVRTALALADGRKRPATPGHSALDGEPALYEDVSITRVWFKPLSARDIQQYCASSEPYDKAGGYGIQGLAGVFVERIEGSFTGVIGLPLYETARLLRNVGILVP